MQATNKPPANMPASTIRSCNSSIGQLIHASRRAQVADEFAIFASDAAVTSALLAGRFVQLLERSTVDAAEKQALTDLVTSLGGAVTFRIKESRGTDLCIAGSAPDRKFAAALRTHERKLGAEYDVLRAPWLRRCAARGRLLEAAAADYAHLSDRTLGRLVTEDGCDACAAPLISPEWDNNSIDLQWTPLLQSGTLLR